MKWYVILFVVVLIVGRSFAELPTTGLVAHWTTESGITESGGVISSWVDAVGGYDANQTTEAKRPILTTDWAARDVVCFPYSSAAPAFLACYLDIETDFSLAVSDSTVYVVASQIQLLSGAQSSFTLGDEPHGLVRLNAGATLVNTSYFEDKASTQGPVPCNISLLGRRSTASNNCYVIDASGMSASLGTPYNGGDTLTGGSIARNNRDNDEYQKAFIYEIAVYSPAQDDANVAATIAHFKDAYDIVADGSTTEYTDGQLACIGDSITAGYGSTLQQSYPAQFWPDHPNLKVFNLGSSGDSIASLTSRATGTDGLYNATKYSENILMVLIGRNDVKTTDAAEVYADLDTYCEARVATGWDVWVGTVIACSDVEDQNEIDDLNALIRGDVGDGIVIDAGVTKVIDFAANAVFDEIADASNATYYVDGTHLTNAGYAVLASILDAQFPSGSSEDFTTWTEVDTQGYLTVTEPNIVATDVPRNQICYLYKDFGVAHFEDVNCKFIYTPGTMSHTDDASFLGAIAFGNTYGDWYAVGGSPGARACTAFQGRTTSGYYLGLWHEETMTYDQTDLSGKYVSVGTAYYCHLTLDGDAGTNSDGLWTMTIATSNYADEGGDLFDTLTVNVPDGEQTAFRYAMVTLSMTNGGTQSASGRIEDLEFLEGAEPPVGTGGNGPYYVSPTGNNANDGNTPAEAWETIEYALETGHPSSDANDVIYLLTGDYNDISLANVDVNSTGWDDAFTITPADGNDPNITSIAISGTTAYVIFLDVPITQADEDVYGRKALHIKSSHIRFSGTLTCDWDTEEADDMTTYGVYIDGTENEVNDVTIHDSTITQCNWGVEVAGDITGNIYLQDLTFSEINQGCVEVDSDEDHNDILIEDCIRAVQTFAKVNSTMSGDPHGAAISIRTINVTVRRCAVTGFGGSGGIRVYDNGSEAGYRGITIENCIVWGGGVAEPFHLYDLEGDCTIRNNLVQSRHSVSTSFDPTRYIGAWSANPYSADANNIKVYNNIFMCYGSFSSSNDDIIDVNNNVLWSWNYDSAYASTYKDNIIICTGDNSFNEGYTATWAETPTYLWLGSPTFADYFSYGGSVQSDYTVFRLIESAVVVDAADADESPDTDFTGATRDASPDIGPYEYFQSGTPPRRILIRRL